MGIGNFSHINDEIFKKFLAKYGGGGGGSTLPSIVTDGSAPVYTLNGKNVYCKEFVVDNLPNATTGIYDTDIDTSKYKLVDIVGYALNSDGSFDNNLVPIQYPSLTTSINAIRMYTNETTDRATNIVQVIVSTDTDRSTRKGVFKLYYAER